MDAFAVTMSAAASLAVLTYLWVQAAQDAKTGYVSRMANDVAVALSGAGYAVAVAVCKPPLFGLVLNAVLFALAEFVCLFPFKGRAAMKAGDGKAVAVVFLSSSVWGSFSGALDIALGTVIAASVWSLLKERKKGLSRRVPFFPYLARGASLVFVVYWAARFALTRA